MIFRKDISQVAHFTGFLLFAFSLIIYSGSSLMLLCGRGMSGYLVPLSGITSIILLTCIKRTYSLSVSHFWIICITFLCVVVLSIVLSSFFYDKSWDGQAYHQGAVIQLASGWNPYVEKLDENIEHAKWIQHYAKGPWILATTLYLYLNALEASKAFNIIFLAASWFIVFSLVFEIKKNSDFLKLSIATVAVLNPVAICQNFSFYVDGQLGIMMISIISLFVRYVLIKEKSSLILLAGLIIYTLNIKFTAVPFILVFASGFLLYLFFYQKAMLKNFLFIFLLSFVLGLGVFGYNPYVVNTINNGHPFFPLMGKGAEDIMSYTTPVNLKDKNRFSALFLSIFSKSANNLETTKLKVPLTVYVNEELGAFADTDTRISGFGPFFGIMFMLSIISVIYTMFREKENQSKMFLAALVFIITFSVIIHPECWWARYAPQLWLIPCVSSVIGLIMSDKLANLFGSAIIVLGIFNIALVGAVNVESHRLMTEKINNQLSSLSHHHILVEFGPFESAKLRLRKAGVNFTEVRDGLRCERPEMLAGGIKMVKYCIEEEQKEI